LFFALAALRNLFLFFALIIIPAKNHDSSFFVFLKIQGICTANTQQQQTQHQIYCQSFFGLKWVVIFAGICFILNTEKRRKDFN
jgi:hypothetical protein